MPALIILVLQAKRVIKSLTWGDRLNLKRLLLWEAIGVHLNPRNKRYRSQKWIIISTLRYKCRAWRGPLIRWLKMSIDNIITQWIFQEVQIHHLKASKNCQIYLIQWIWILHSHKREIIHIYFPKILRWEQ